MVRGGKAMGQSLKGMDKIVLLSCRSPFLDDSKIYAPMANLYLKSFLELHAPKTEVVLGDDGYDVLGFDMIMVMM